MEQTKENVEMKFDLFVLKIKDLNLSAMLIGSLKLSIIEVLRVKEI